MVSCEIAVGLDVLAEAEEESRLGGAGFRVGVWRYCIWL